MLRWQCWHCNRQATEVMCTRAHTVQGAKGSSRHHCAPSVAVHTNLTGWWRAYPQWPQVKPSGTSSHAARRNALQAPEGPAARPPARVRGLRSRRGYGRARGGALRLAPGQACFRLPRQLQLRAAAAEPGPGCVLRGRGRRVASLLCLLSRPSDQTRASRAMLPAIRGVWKVQHACWQPHGAGRSGERDTILRRGLGSPHVYPYQSALTAATADPRHLLGKQCLQIASCNALHASGRSVISVTVTQ